MKYSEKLKSPKWQKKRLKILERDNWTCQYCGATEDQLQVHHDKYNPNGNPWDIDDKELTTLCFRCHEVVSTLSVYQLKIALDLTHRMFLNGRLNWVKGGKNGS